MADRSVRNGCTRRTVLGAAGTASVAALAGCTGGLLADGEPTTLAAHSSPTLEKWVMEVPCPPVVDPVDTRNGEPHYDIEMREIEQELHPDLPPTTVWGYDGLFPGPTIEAERGEPISVRWRNGLPDEHLLPVDTSIHGDRVPYDLDGVRTVTHLHGGNVEADSDGKARAWYTRDFRDTGPMFDQKDYRYVNQQPPAALWYHDHAIGITRLNVYAGLAGFYLLRSDEERELGLPADEYEIPLVIQDRRFTADGELFYPSSVSEGRRASDDPNPDTSIVPEFYGDVPVVNGAAWPRLTVEPTAYRFRLLNGSNSRYYRVDVRTYDEDEGAIGDDGPAMTLIGVDGGLLPEPHELDDRLELGSSQRADLIVDFSAYAGETLLLHNAAPAGYQGAGVDVEDPEPLPELLVIEVENGGGSASRGTIPDELVDVPSLPREDVTRERYLPLIGSVDDHGRRLPLLGTAEDTGGLRLNDPVTETPTRGDTEIWSFANMTGVSHPIHLHLVHFQVLGREPLSEYDETSAVDPNALEAPESFERGWKDVVSVDPGEVVHVLVHFGSLDGTFSNQTGEYMWHCHMLEHEDHDMMRPFRVESPSNA